MADKTFEMIKWTGIGLFIIFVLIAFDGTMLSMAEVPGTGYSSGTPADWAAYVGAWGVGIIMNLWGLFLAIGAFASAFFPNEEAE